MYYTDAGFTTLLKDSTDGAYGSSINTTAGSFDNPYVNWSANGYRLPTEGEWQYAASYKDGSSWTPYNYASGAYTYYNDTADVNPNNGVVDGKDANDEVAVYGYYWDGSSWVSKGTSKTEDVGTKTANALGIHDMSGNVWEWCWDWYGSWPGTGQSDYRGPGSGSYRMSRGGSWGSSASSLRVGHRADLSPYYEGNNIGFRLSRTP